MKKRFTQSVKNGAALVCAALLLAVCAGGLKAQNPWPDYDFKAANADGAQGKVDWLKKYVPAMDTDHIIIITKGRKVDHMKEEGILIDDDMTNCKQWNKAGYTSIYLETKGQKVEL